MQEEELIQKARHGEPEAFGALYDAYFPKIYRFIFLKVSNKTDAEDICHQVFLNAWQSVGSYRSRGFPFSSWLYRIAHNAVIDFYRTKKEHVAIELVPQERFAATPETERELDQATELIAVQNALGELKSEEQSLLIMKFVGELSNKEIAEALGKTEGAVRVMQHRALKQLRQKLSHGQS